MKRLLCLFPLFILVLTLCACGEPPTVQSDFFARFTVQKDEISYAGTLQKKGSCMTLTMTEPYTVTGMSFCREDSALSIRYAGHSAEVTSDYLPADTVPTALYNSLSYLEQAAYTGTENGTDHFTLPTPYGDAKLTARDGMPTTLDDPYSGMTFYFE